MGRITKGSVHYTMKSINQVPLSHKKDPDAVHTFIVGRLDRNSYLNETFVTSLEENPIHKTIIMTA